jgi:hypothetical protein
VPDHAATVERFALTEAKMTPTLESLLSSPEMNATSVTSLSGRSFPELRSQIPVFQTTPCSPNICFLPTRHAYMALKSLFRPARRRATLSWACRVSGAGYPAVFYSPPAVVLTPRLTSCSSVAVDGTLTRVRAPNDDVGRAVNREW